MRSATWKCPAAPTATTPTRPPTVTCCVTAAVDLADLPVVGLIRDIESAIGTEVRGYTLTIRYICPKCRAKNAQ